MNPPPQPHHNGDLMHCPQCDTDKPPADFAKKNARLGFFGSCAACRNRVTEARNRRLQNQAQPALQQPQHNNNDSDNAPEVQHRQPQRARVQRERTPENETPPERDVRHRRNQERFQARERMEQAYPDRHDQKNYCGSANILRYQPTSDPHTLGELEECQFCGGLAFPAMATGRDENGLLFGEHCCLNGAVRIPETHKLKDPPPQLDYLMNSQAPDAVEFRNNILQYNNALAFTSTKYQSDDRLNNIQGGNRGPARMVSIHGELFHYQGPLLPDENNRPPAFNQLFFYDPDEATRRRASAFPGLRRDLLLQLHTMLEAVNPYVNLYKTAREQVLEQQAIPGPFRILLNPAARLVMQRGDDQRRANLPTAQEVAAIIPGDDIERASCRDILLAYRDNNGMGQRFNRIHPSHGLYMPAHYVLLFPRGEPGWHFGLPLEGRLNGRLTQRQFWRFRVTPRLIGDGKIHHLFHAKKLFQKFIIDCYITCEDNKLEWIETHQDQLRAELYTGMQDAFVRGDVDPATVGRRRILPSNFIGSDRWFHHCYQNSMAIQRELGTPTWFLTFTANPGWPEITKQLLRGESYQDRPDLIADVFNYKVEALLEEVKQGILGPVSGFSYTIEYQKRGLPHMHLLIQLDKQVQRRYKTPQLIDQFISAELPDASLDPDGSLRTLVTSYMLHGPCQGKSCRPADWPQSKPFCTKRFPRAYTDATTMQDNGVVIYRRRNNGATYQKQVGDHVYTNQDVVPYNPYLLRKYRAHINLEYCASSNKAIKYLYKYVYKGTDRATLEIEHTDEIKTYKTGRYVSGPEGGWRLKEYRTHQEWPSVMLLQVHLKNHHQVTFNPERPAEIQQRMEASTTPLIQFFEYNRTHPEAPQYLYAEFPLYFTWNGKQWKPRKQGRKIARLAFCNPTAGERYYLRLLLCKVRGPTSFEELYEHNGTRHETYQDACIARGWSDGNRDWIHSLDEGVNWGMPLHLRGMFITGLLSDTIPMPSALWEQYKAPMCDDLRHRLERYLEQHHASPWPQDLEQPECDFGLFQIDQELRRNGKELATYGLRRFTVNWEAIFREEVGGMAPAEQRAVAEDMISKLNPDQRAIFNTVLSAIASNPALAHFYLQGPGGTGKTFLYRALTHHLRSQGKTVLCVASTGIAALLLPGGRTAHSMFGIPLKLDNSSISSISAQHIGAAQLRQADLIIWDEVPMQHKLAFECVDRLLQDLRGNDSLFGGTPVILGGDFSQILPVVPDGTRSDIVSACLQESYIWHRLKILHLTKNMRLSQGPRSDAFLRWISSIPFDPSKVPMTAVPPYLSQPKDSEDLVNRIYPPALLQRAPFDPTTFRGRVIVTPKNDTVVDINSAVTARFPGVAKIYESRNTCDADEDNADGIVHIPEEELNSLETASLPPGTLTLKVGMPVMLMRNMKISEGLCNGTRMVITRLGEFNVFARILGGDFDGREHMLFRIKLSSNERDFDYILTRYQFPFKPCFAMTIHKSQGQSYSDVGVDLEDPCFVHGMLYVAMSRTSRVDGLHIRVKDTETSLTENISYPEVLIKPPPQ